MRDLVATILYRALQIVDRRRPAFRGSPHDAAFPPTAFTPDLTLSDTEAKTFRSVGRIAQRLARHFGGRQNSESKLTPREATDVVSSLLNCGNLMVALADRQHPEPPPAPPKETPK